jgi:hypothetical protein
MIEISREEIWKATGWPVKFPEIKTEREKYSLRHVNA